MTTIDTLHPAVTAADYTIAAVGADAAAVLLNATRAGWLTAAEARSLEPLAAGLGYLLEKPVREHRGVACRVQVARADVAKHVARAVR